MFEIILDNSVHDLMFTHLKSDLKSALPAEDEGVCEGKCCFTPASRISSKFVIFRLKYKSLQKKLENPGFVN